MEKPTAKRVRLSTEDVRLELEDEDVLITAGSDDEFDDITCEERQSNGGIVRVHQSQMHNVILDYLLVRHTPYL